MPNLLIFLEIGFKGFELNVFIFFFYLFLILLWAYDFCLFTWYISMIHNTSSLWFREIYYIYKMWCGWIHRYLLITIDAFDVENSILVTSCAWLRGRLFNFNSQCSLWLLWKDSLSCWNLIIHIPCLTMITIIVSQNELVHNVESLVKLNFHIPSPRFMHLNVCCSLVTFGNTHKVDTKATMNEIKMINQHWSWCTMPPLSK